MSEINQVHQSEGDQFSRQNLQGTPGDLPAFHTPIEPHRSVRRQGFLHRPALLRSMAESQRESSESNGISTVSDQTHSDRGGTVYETYGEALDAANNIKAKVLWTSRLNIVETDDNHYVLADPNSPLAQKARKAGRINRADVVEGTISGQDRNSQSPSFRQITEQLAQETNAIASGGELTSELSPILQTDIQTSSFRDFELTRSVIEIPKAEALDDFIANMIAQKPIPEMPKVSRFLLRLARSANDATIANGCEYKATAGTDGESFLSTPLVQGTPEDTRDLDGIVSFNFNYAGFKKILTFHNHPEKAGKKRAGFSLSDAEKIITQTPDIINALSTTTDLYIATAYPKRQVVDDPQHTTHEDIFGQEVYDHTWTDEQREQNVAEVFRKYDIRYLKFPLANPLEVVILA